MAERPGVVPDFTALASYQQTEGLPEAPETAVTNVRRRFLHVHHRSGQRLRAGGGFKPIDALTLDQRFLTFDDAVTREHGVAATVAELRSACRRVADPGRGGCRTPPRRVGAHSPQVPPDLGEHAAVRHRADYYARGDFTRDYNSSKCQARIGF